MKLAKERGKNKGLRRNVGGGVMRVVVFTALPPPVPPLSISSACFEIQLSRSQSIR